MRGIKEKRATGSGGAVNKCTLGMNKVSSCLYRAVIHSPASPKAPTSLGIVWTWCTGSMVGMVYKVHGTRAGGSGGKIAMLPRENYRGKSYDTRH